MTRSATIDRYHAYNTFVVKNIEVTLKCTSADAFVTDPYTFERLQRVVNSCERAYHRALKELQAKVTQTLSPANPGPQPQESPQPKESKPTSTSSASFCTNPKTPAPAATAAPAEACPTPPIGFQTPGTHSIPLQRRFSSQNNRHAISTTFWSQAGTHILRPVRYTDRLVLEMGRPHQRKAAAMIRYLPASLAFGAVARGI